MRCFIETTKGEPLQSCSSEGVLLCLLALTHVRVKPLAQKLSYDLYSDRDEKGAVTQAQTCVTAPFIML